MRFAPLATILVVLPVFQACTSDSQAEEAPRYVQQAPATTTAAPAGDLAARFVSHTDHIQPGMVKPFAGMRLVNPLEGNANAVATGAKLFVSYNCIDCHGADGAGAMGPSLADGRWHFGGSNAEVFESIYQGRPEGMPAWGSLISDDQIWMLVSYVRSLAKDKNVTSENFSGATVERTGH
ncbi:MAG: c-type cytochrome [Gemmatimonadaceae bacterium]